MSASETVPLQVLFVCVGNSCRSQMAEAFANHLGNGRVRVYSAGSYPLGTIIPETHRVMEEKGITLTGQWSKGLNDVPVAEVDVVVSMGCEVVCPVPKGFKGRIVEWDIPDPYNGGIVLFRRVRDLIEQEVTGLLGGLLKEGDGPVKPIDH